MSTRHADTILSDTIGVLTALAVHLERQPARVVCDVCDAIGPADRGCDVCDLRARRARRARQAS